uniref:Uncharacterized protein n=1 Tax=Oryza meridionalis TaxID=40149 RepID=A0A0E0D4Q9_9ORYZ
MAAAPLLFVLLLVSLGAGGARRAVPHEPEGQAVHGGPARLRERRRDAGGEGGHHVRRRLRQPERPLARPARQRPPVPPRRPPPPASTAGGDHPSPVRQKLRRPRRRRPQPAHPPPWGPPPGRTPPRCSPPTPPPRALATMTLLLCEPLRLRPIAQAVLEAGRMGRAPAREQARIADEHLPYIEHWDAMWHELGRWRRRGEWGGPFTGVLRERANIGSAEEALAVVGWTFRQKLLGDGSAAAMCRTESTDLYDKLLS